MHKRLTKIRPCIVYLSHGVWQLIPNGFGVQTFYSLPDGTVQAQTEIINFSFPTDGATIPRPLWPIPFLSPHDWMDVAIVHDWRYEGGTVGRYTADWELYLLLKAKGIHKLIAFSVWMLVRIFGWYPWMKKRRLYRGLNYSKQIKCTLCYGVGKIPNSENSYITCPQCNGESMIYCADDGLGNQGVVHPPKVDDDTVDYVPKSVVGDG